MERISVLNSTASLRLRLLRRFAPRNDTGAISHCDGAIDKTGCNGTLPCVIASLREVGVAISLRRRLLRRFTPRNDTEVTSQGDGKIEKTSCKIILLSPNRPVLLLVRFS